MVDLQQISKIKPVISETYHKRFPENPEKRNTSISPFFFMTHLISCLLKLLVLFYPLRLEFNAKRLDKSKESGYVIRF
jgi:hypothetical protein